MTCRGVPIMGILPYIADRAHRGAHDANMTRVADQPIFDQRNEDVPPTRSYRKWIVRKEGAFNL